MISSGRDMWIKQRILTFAWLSDVFKHAWTCRSMLGSAKIAHPRFQRPRSSLFCPVSGLKVYEFYLKYRRCTYVLLGPEITNTDLDTILCAVLDGITPILEDYIKETILDSMANIMVCLFPKAPQPADNNRLRPVSNIGPAHFSAMPIGKLDVSWAGCLFWTHVPQQAKFPGYSKHWKGEDTACIPLCLAIQCIQCYRHHSPPLQPPWWVCLLCTRIWHDILHMAA